METRRLGGTDMDVTVLGFGGAEIGYENASPDTVGVLLNTALDAGLNVIDTAECYPNSEEMIGRAVAHRRGSYFLFTKAGHASGLDFPDWDPRLLERSIDRSLKRLRTDRVDLVQLHSCTESLLRQGDVIAVLLRARDAGKTRYIGYSGDDQAALYAVGCGAFDTLQTSVSIADQQAIDLTIPLARLRGVGVIAKRPISNAVWKFGAKPGNAYYHAYWDRLRKLDYDFLHGGPLDPEPGVATALRFTLSVPGVHTAIVGTKNPQRWGRNARLLETGKLPQKQFDAIRKHWKSAAEVDWIGQT